MKSIIANGWSDHRSKITRNTGVKKGFHGSFFYNDANFEFTADEQKASSCYRLKGQLKLLAPNGKVLDTVVLYVRVNDMEDVKQKVEQRAIKLCAKHERALLSETRDAASLLDMHAMRAFTAYNGQYLNRRRASPKYRAQLKRKLKYICSLLDNKPLRKITVTDIRKIYAKLVPDAAEVIRLMEQFWDFCKQKGACEGDNPFTEYRRTYLPKRKRGNTERLQKTSAEQQVFDEKSKLRSLTLLLDNIEDGRGTGILLIGDGGLSSSKAAGLTWSSMVFDPDDYSHVTLKMFLPDCAGATHDYTHPVFPYAGILLHRRFDLMAERYGEAEALKLPVVSKAKDATQPLGQRELATYCRTHLREVFDGVEPEREPMAPEGAGVQFLQRDYRNRLEYVCGMKAIPQAVAYMRCGSLAGDVTSDHYCGFSSEYGQWFLWSFVQRERRFDRLFGSLSKETAKPYTTEPLPDGGVRVVLPCAEPGKLYTHKLRLLLPEGGIVTAHSLHGVEITDVRILDKSEE